MPALVTAARLASLLTTAPPSGGPAYADLAERVRVLVIDGRLADGTRLPSERELAASLGVSRTTTARVYAELRDAGFIASRQGSGSVVRVPMGASTASSLIVMPNDPDTIAMTYSAPVGPPGLGRAFEAAVAKLPGLLATTGYLPDGLPALRERLAQRYTDRGLATDPEQIIVTNGALGAISLLARTLMTPGARTLVEPVSYPHAHESFTSAGGRLSALPVGDTPWEVDALDALLRSAPHRAAYLIPDFHNPTGAIMSEEQRSAWAQRLRRHDVLPVVDESLREINLDGTALPASYSAFDARAVLVDSASKVFWGGLRVGWVRAPHSLVMPLVQARMTTDLGSAAFEQLVLTELLDDGGQTAAAGRATLRAGRDHLLAELATHLPDVTTTCPPGGLNLWLTLPRRMSTSLVAAAARHGLLLTPGPRFFAQPGPAGERHLRLPFTQTPETLSEAVQRLRAAYDEVLSGSDSPRRASGTLDLIA